MSKFTKLVSLLLTLVLLISLCACGAKEEEEASVQMDSVLPGADAAIAEDKASDAESEEEPVKNEDMETALSLVGEDVSKLYEAIGEPNESSYASSCLGPGEDGELVYDGFSVYTYKEGNSEIIQEVL